MSIDIEISKLFHAIFGEYVEARSQAEFSELWRAWECCQSPIEQRLVTALRFIILPFFFSPAVNDPRSHLYPTPLVTGPDPIGSLESALRAGEFGDEVAFLCLQAPVLTYRADFLLLVKMHDRSDLLRVVIECDGHDFHERTKEQARHDKQRDRAMTAAGFKVFRFTGSEVFRDPCACAAEIAKFVDEEEYRTRP